MTRCATFSDPADAPAQVQLGPACRTHCRSRSRRTGRSRSPSSANAVPRSANRDSTPFRQRDRAAAGSPCPAADPRIVAPEPFSAGSPNPAIAGTAEPASAAPGPAAVARGQAAAARRRTAARQRQRTQRRQPLRRPSGGVKEWRSTGAILRAAIRTPRPCRRGRYARCHRHWNSCHRPPWEG